MRLYPALLVVLSSPTPARAEELLAILDDFQPNAIQEEDDALRVFFTRAADRDDAHARLRQEADVTLAIEEVSDEDWAARSQQAIGAVSVGALTIAPPWAVDKASPSTHTIVIQPSMGFGTGHHQSTRLCVRLLQETPIEGRSVLDVGTGSGVLAIAASVLGAGRVVGVDVDADALTNARENLGLNPAAARVELAERDLSAGISDRAERFDVVFANLTGGLLIRDASRLAALVAPGGTLIASGFQAHEYDEVCAAFARAGLQPCQRLEEDSWVGVRLTIADRPQPSI